MNWSGVTRHHRGITPRRRRLMSDVDERHSSRLRKDRRGLAGRAEVDRTHVQSLKQLRSAGELRPFHLNAEPLERFLEIALAFEQRRHHDCMKRAPSGNPGVRVVRLHFIAQLLHQLN